jgi:ArsR family transcriptional regulator
MKIRNYEVFNLHAEICKLLASPKRLVIIDMLGKREMSVGEIAEALDTPPANVSQHLRLLRDHQLVSTRKAAQTVYYRLAMPRMMEACHIIREILLENLKRRGAIAEDVNPEDLIEDLFPPAARGVETTPGNAP